MTPNFCLGVDPGLQGALCLLRCRGLAIEAIHDMPTTNGRVDPARIALIVGMCQLRGTIHAAVELVSSMPRQAGAFNFGVSAGCVHGVLGALQIPYTLVSPAVWKGATGLHRLTNETQADVKSRARFLATKLWPAHADSFKLVKNDGRAESALLARFFCTKQGWI